MRYCVFACQLAHISRLTCAASVICKGFCFDCDFSLGCGVDGGSILGSGCDVDPYEHQPMHLLDELHRMVMSSSYELRLIVCRPRLMSETWTENMRVNGACVDVACVVVLVLRCVKSSEEETSRGIF